MRPVPSFTAYRKIAQDLWASFSFNPGVERAAAKVAARLLSNLPRYLALQERLGIPAAFLMITHERESGGNWNTYAGNGDPLFAKDGTPLKSRNVPPGRGPFKNYEDGAYDAYCVLQGLDKVGIANWDEARMIYLVTGFNGWGYWEYHEPEESPYLWGGTNHQTAGKYTSDGHFDTTVMDPQLGAMAIYAAIIEIHPELDIGGAADTPKALQRAGVVLPPVAGPQPTPVLISPAKTGAATSAVVGAGTIAYGAFQHGIPVPIVFGVMVGIVVVAVVIHNFILSKQVKP